MTEERKERQLVLFEGEPVPESRAKALAKIEKKHGRDAAIRRNNVYNLYGVMKEQITAKTGAEPGKAMISRQRAINKAVGIDSIKNCPPQKYGRVMVCCNVVIDGYGIKDPEDRKEFIAAGLRLEQEARERVENLLQKYLSKEPEAKAA